MSAVADAIETAEAEVLITDWQMNPEIFLKRPDSGVESLYWRLDKMLLRKADEGVRVKILLYQELKQAIDLGSSHVVKLLGNHDNIEVHRHPDFITAALQLFRWSHHEKIVIVDGSVAFVGGIDLCYGRWDTRKHELMDEYPIHSAVNGSEVSDDQENPRSHRNHARWIGKDYRNTFYNTEKRTDWDEPLKGYDGVDRNAIPRMPWHDVSCAFTGEAVYDCVSHFRDRYNVITKTWWARCLDLFHHYFQSTAYRAIERFAGKKTKAEEIVFKSGGHNVSIQMLRSVDNLSAGVKHEDSIYRAYLDAIKNAQHFIYIENQFFISSQDGILLKVKNQIQSALVERIVRAHQANEDFHVMIIIPIKPEFPGDLDDKDMNGKALRTVTFWIESTLFEGKDSLFCKLEKENISQKSAMKYFSLFSLRTYDLIGTRFVTEIVYVHSKIMIVDDRLAIIGSANINDRSMLGGRDSEVAVLIEDLEYLDGKMNGVDFKMGKFAHSLRCDLLKEHLGIVGDNEECFSIDDPLASNSIKDIRHRSARNDELFRNAFDVSCTAENFEEIEALNCRKGVSLSCANTAIKQKILKQIKGNLVKFTRTKRELEPSLDVLDLTTKDDCEPPPKKATWYSFIGSGWRMVQSLLRNKCF
ncbi:phospholipase D zeta 1-like [Dendronephthya gigantea]|uniref:phospholipase D zeta 1-like n=1 Tax=Dendronephthya gigantea TaxID=151771 RepID=UPI00106C6555|nr:phospholipase D zeta 1-like [Dendronephthya gigantea]